MESKELKGLAALEPLLEEVKERLINGKYEFENQEFLYTDYCTGDCNFGNFAIRCSFNEGGFISHHNSLGSYLDKIMTSTDEKRACKEAWKKAKVKKLISERNKLQSSLEALNTNIEKLRANGNAI